MAKFAVVEGGIVINTILAESKEVAEQVTGKTCVEFTDESVEINGTYADNEFRKIKPYPSWVYNGKGDWNPPVEYPLEEEKSFRWDEETLSWVEKILEE